MSNERLSAKATGLLARLRHDVRANTMAIMAAALVPLTGLIGGGLDMSRLYMTKSRIQHACDAGALAARKEMGGGRWSQNSGRPNAVALQFFDANFASGSLGSTGLTRSFTESAGKVTGSASVTVPMTLMRVLGQTTQTITVTCDAEMRLPNTDVMFVLDTTGSMGQRAVPTDTETKIEGLRTAVKCFYEIVARLDTDATCTTGTPGGGTGTQTQIRFGFVPYSTNVNVGKLLPTSYFADTGAYQTREAVYRTEYNYTFPNPGTPVQGTSSDSAPTPSTFVTTPSATSSSNCSAQRPANTSNVVISGPSAPINPQTSANGATQTVTYTTTSNLRSSTYSSSYTGNPRVCRITENRSDFVRTTNWTRTDTGVGVPYQVFDGWHYGQINVPISRLKNGTLWNNSMTLAIGSNGADRSINWGGCIEERQTVSQSSYSPIPSGAKDLNIDLIPSSSDATTLWKPALPGLTYLRKYLSSNSQLDIADVAKTSDEYSNNPFYFCPTEAKKLQAWPDADAFDDYVDSLNPAGNTYHDIGMIWGARLASPTGIFASENALTPLGGEIDRHIIFMTDGDAQGSSCDYSAYGIAFFDRRTTSNVGSASNCSNANSAIIDQINARLDGLCTAVKNMPNTTLWVISFGSGSNTTTETRLSNCATPGRYFTARSSSSLQSTFASIANQISQLRLTR